MDLGATVCRPKSPLCGDCPLTSWCAAFQSGQPEPYPLKTKKADRPRRVGTAWVLRDASGRVALVRRPNRGLLGGMLALPTSDWSTTPDAAAPPVDADWRDAGGVEHVFTHFSLSLAVRAGESAGGGDFIWTPVDEALASLPTVFRKALERGLA